MLVGLPATRNRGTPGGCRLILFQPPGSPTSYLWNRSGEPTAVTADGPDGPGGEADLLGRAPSSPNPTADLAGVGKDAHVGTSVRRASWRGPAGARRGGSHRAQRRTGGNGGSGRGGDPANPGKDQVV